MNVTDEAEDGLGALRVERAGGLVAEEDLRLRGEGAGDGHALLLAAGELGRIVFQLVAEADQLQKLCCALHRVAALHACQLQREGNVALARALHEQVEALKNHGDVAPGRAKLCLAERRHVAAVDDDLAAGRPLEHVDAADEGALARAAHADDAVDFAVRDGQRHIFQRLSDAAGCGKRLGQVLYLDHLVPPTYRNNAVSISPSALFP